jgi:hypothetical protein
MNVDQLWHIGSIVASVGFFAVILHKASSRIRALLAEWREMKKALGSSSVESTEATEERISSLSVLVVLIGVTSSVLVLYNVHLQQTSPSPIMSFVASVVATLNILGAVLAAFGDRVYKFFKNIKTKHEVLNEQVKELTSLNEQRKKEVEEVLVKTHSLQEGLVALMREQIILRQLLEEKFEALARELNASPDPEQLPVQRKLDFMAYGQTDKVELLKSLKPQRSSH